MALFNFLKRKESKESKILMPKVCPTEIPVEISDKIDEVNWPSFETAYGNAKATIPFYLKNLFCTDNEIAMEATHQLWCSLCHQHAYISTASLPSYDILRMGLLTLGDNLKIELLDIFEGFAECTSKKYFETVKQMPMQWEIDLRNKLILDKPIFQGLATHSNEEMSSFAKNIYENLMNDN